MRKFKQIIEAFWHLVTDALMITDHQNRAMAKDRMTICNRCEFLKNDTCTLCDCYMPGKTTVPTAECKIKKW